MKILYITNGINDAGGLERVLSIKSSYLAEHFNYDITILSLNNNHLNPFYKFSDKINMISIPVEGNVVKYILSYKDGVKSIIGKIQPDLISVCDDGLKGFLIPIFLNLKVPIIYERHASVNLNFNRGDYNLLGQFKNKLQYFIMQRAAKKFDRFVVLTNGNLKEWRSTNLLVIPNPLSFLPKQMARLQNKEVIAVGSHSYNKGYDLLLLAWKKVLQNQPDWSLNIYGKIDENRTFLTQAENLGLEEAVNFIPPVKEIQTKYIESSIMVLPSRSEGFGMVLIEAMACGVPCVSFDCPEGPADIIENGKDGYLVENGNIEKLASHILKLIEDENLRVEMGAKARENVKRFLPEVIVKQWDELFKSLVH
ncbi:glycosyltransferase family 4 protein [Mesonia sp. HuA40]|uniref:glycosyltransferase family 4 protein n=1 Tax=Mesonia sp. HuA40 TaxID=2602761 RepID=UPI0011CCD0C0|nr:glycosyltransferase family 4 protein [Mesonia sp. HuA40]TXK75411.1 glycosyltransferase family 4 protein [Mesonia sp. HuA40]